ncbi:transcriptional regulator [Mycolicibacterium celeriflavum]|uniref:heat shock protein transcriptional repressor HspR n=1 Tax=Mycolicibacterium celeriflavum TaxID=1249101 RepID=UPI0007FB84B9|nr:helix-turn-helix transcriptional regulator [Mycolicibacterium celeriflavum]OBG21881.1 transcriptional regulator [Mycolicibacterium celeriflavum]
MKDSTQRGEPSARKSAKRARQGVYGISVTAELSGLGPQTLRLYERRGLLTPERTDGGTRRYSEDDLARLQRITELTDDGVNLAGVARILDLEARNAELQADNSKLEADNVAMKSDRVRAQDP